MRGKWIGVDLDGTLARFACDWASDYRNIGEPVPAMVERVKGWLAEGHEVRIMTARADRNWRRGKNKELTQLDDAAFASVIKAIEDWCEKYIGAKLPITNCKDYNMEVLYDDRARQVEKDTGRIIGDGGSADESDHSTRGFGGQEGLPYSEWRTGLLPGRSGGDLEGVVERQ